MKTKRTKQLSLGEIQCLYEKGLSHLQGFHGNSINFSKARQVFKKISKQLTFYTDSIDCNNSPSKNEIFKGQFYCCDSIYRVGILYMEGLGVKQDAKKAEKWFLRISEPDLSLSTLGYEWAQLNLGRMYVNGGLGIEKDHNKAKLYFVRAALQGNAESQYLLGNLFEKVGEREEAFMWYCMAAHNKQCDENFKASQRKLFATLTEEDLEKSNAKANQFKKLVADENPKAITQEWMKFKIPSGID